MVHDGARPRRGRPPSVDLDAILDAAEEVGLEALTSTAVAARLGVSEGTIRHHTTNADRLYSLASARILSRVDVRAPAATTWRGYLEVLCARTAATVRAHPGVESYLVHGPYTDETIELFETIGRELESRSLSPAAAYLVGSRALILTASTLAVRSTRYPPGVEPHDRHRDMFHWMLDAFLTGAETLVARGDVPEFAPTSEQEWARLRT